MQVKKGSQVTVCSECGQVFRLELDNIQPKPLGDGIDDYGIVCPKCRHFAHSFYINNRLRTMQKEDATRQERRQYKHEFVKFQHKMEKRLHRYADTSQGY